MDELTGKREALKDLMEQYMKRVFNRLIKRHYKMGNKPGKLLAGVNKPRRNPSCIVKMKDEKGELKYSMRDISKTFLDYYQLIYKVSNTQNCDDIQRRRNKIEQYLQKINLPVIPEEGSIKLDSDISKEEIE